jgi:peptidoglycan/LPS O-acetylase OafA/YrhL
VVAVAHGDDAVLSETRWASWIIVAVLVPAAIVLWVLPHRTAQLWAWTFEPQMTAIFMGSGYGAGAYFFARVARSGRWHPASAGVLSAAIFAALMLAVTVVHYDRFNHGDAPLLAAVAFYGWMVVYIVSPLAVGWLWQRNERLDSRAAAGDGVVVAASVQRVAQLVGVGALVAATVCLISPSTAIDVWPWPLTPLTARVIACFTAQVGIGALLLSRDERWSAWRLLLQTFLVATALLLVGAARARGDFDGDRPMTWLFLGGLVGLTLAVAVLYRTMDRRRGRGPHQRRREEEPASDAELSSPEIA